MIAENSPLSIGLGGDGDEIAAVEEVEREFRVTLDKTTAPGWYTAGDVYESLLAALPESDGDGSDVWRRFTEAICRETGVDPKLISKESPLLSNVAFWRYLVEASAILWMISILALALTILFLVLNE